MKFLFPIICSFLMIGCATTYKNDGFSGGFNEIQISENIWRVTFRGNGFTNAQRAEEMAMLRSAELTLMNGYKYFVFIDSKTSTSTHAISAPATSTTTGIVNTYGNTAYISAATTTSGGGVTYIRKPSTTNTVMMFKNKSTADTLVFDAEFICNSMGLKYEVKCTAVKKE